MRCRSEISLWLQYSPEAGSHTVYLFNVCRGHRGEMGPVLRPDSDSKEVLSDAELFIDMDWCESISGCFLTLDTTECLHTKPLLQKETLLDLGVLICAETEN